MRTLAPTLFALPLLLTSACGTGAKITGDVAGFGFDLRTVYAWLDATESDQMDGRIVYTTRDRKTLRVVMSGASFDPEQDMRFMSASELQDLGRENTNNGSISFNVTNFDAVTNGLVLISPREDGTEDDPRLTSINHRYAQQPLEPDAVYPAEVIGFGSRETYQLTITEAGKARGETFSGTLVIRIERDDDDRQDARTGEITVEFDASVIGEAIAECNNSEGQSSSCELIRLAPEPAAAGLRAAS